MSPLNHANEMSSRHRAKRWRVAVTLALVATVSTAAFVATATKEPQFRGIGLRQWLCDFDSHSLYLKQEATAAVEAMGEASLPTLIDLLEKRDSRFMERVVALAESVNVPAFVHWEHTPAAAWQLRAMKACRVLGPAARPAVPALMDLLADPQIGHEVAATLADVQGELFPLTRTVTNCAFSAEIRMRAARRLAAPVYAQRPETLTVLRAATHDQVASVRSEAAVALARLGTASETPRHANRNLP